MPNDECDNYNPTLAIVTGVAAATLIVIAVVIACTITCMIVIKRGNRRRQAEILYAHSKEMHEKADNTDDGEARQSYRQSAIKYEDAAVQGLETDEGDLQEEGAIDNPTHPGSTTDDKSAIN